MQGKELPNNNNTKRNWEPVYPCRVEGWLNIWDWHRSFLGRGYNAHEYDDQSLSESYPEFPDWQPRFCVLLQNIRKFYYYSTEEQAKDLGHNDLPLVRLDGGKEAFIKYWGYDTLDTIKENAFQQHKRRPTQVSSEGFLKTRTLESSNTSLQDSSNEKFSNERRGSMPLVSSVDGSSMDGTTSKLANFFTKKGLRTNLKRTKSVTKLDRKRSVSNVSETETKKMSPFRRSWSLGRLNRWNLVRTETTAVAMSIINSKIRTSRSHESLLTNQPTMHDIELANTSSSDIRPVHNSLLGQEQCFYIPTSKGRIYGSCKNKEEQDRWVESLRKGVQPNLDECRRVDNSLKLWVWEAKNIPPKKKYFCEIFLDNAYCAKTSSKTQAEMLFWGEFFEFNNLKNITQIIIQLYREADKKKKKDKTVKIGCVSIPVLELGNKQLIEKWFTANSIVVGKQGRENRAELPLVRVRVKYQSVQILPLELYHDFTEYICNNYVTLCELLEPLVSVREKEDIATCLVHALQHMDKAKNFLCDVVMEEISRLDNEHLTFRGNSIATKAMEAYMKLIGEDYLKLTLRDFVKTIIDSTEECEVDPTKLTNNAVLQKNQENLKLHCQTAWKLIFNSKSYFPGELREVFAGFRDNCLKSSKADLANNLISGSIFLRFLCPAILSPSLFKLIQEYPSDKAVRTLTLIAKAIQKLANFTQFGGKEEFMVFLNDFVEDEMENMRHFLEDISTLNKDNAFLKNHADIDLGKELSILHSLLTDTLEKFNETTVQKLHPLPEILGTLSAALKDPQAGLKQPNRKSQIYDNMTGTPGSSPPVSSLVQLCSKTVNQSKEAKLSSSVHINRHAEESWTSVNKEHRSSSSSSELHGAFRKLSVGTDISDVSVTKHAENKKDSVNQTWSEILTTADVMNGQDNMISYIDDIQEGFLEIGSVDKNNHDFSHNNHSNNIGGMCSTPKSCIGQSSFMSSSDYQPIGYRQSTLPGDFSSGGGGATSPHEQYSDMSLPSRLPSSGGSLTPQHSSSIQQPLSFSNPLYKHQRNTQLTASSPSPLLGNGSPVTVPLAGGAVAGASPMAASAACLTPTLASNAMKLPQTSSSSSLSSTDDSNAAQMHQNRSPSRLPLAATAIGVGNTMDAVHKISNPLQTLSQFPGSSSSSESSLCERRNYGRVGPPTEMEGMQHGPALQRINPLYAHCSPKPLSPEVYMRPPRQTGNGPSNLFSDMSPSTNLAFAGPQFEDSLRSLNSVGDPNQLQCNTLPRRAERDRQLTASCISDEFSMYTPGSRRSLAQTSTSMGLRGTPQHHPKMDKTKEEYEKEVLILRQELMEVRSQLHEANCRSRFNPETGAQQMMQDWQQRLEESEERMRKQQAEKDDQMKTIIERSESEVQLVNKVAVAQVEDK